MSLSRRLAISRHPATCAATAKSSSQASKYVVAKVSSSYCRPILYTVCLVRLLMIQVQNRAATFHHARARRRRQSPLAAASAIDFCEAIETASNPYIRANVHGTCIRPVFGGPVFFQSAVFPSAKSESNALSPHSFAAASSMFIGRDCMID